MADKEAADRALKEPNPIIDGRKANVNLAILGAKPRGNLTGLKDIIIRAQVVVVAHVILVSSPIPIGLLVLGICWV